MRKILPPLLMLGLVAGAQAEERPWYVTPSLIYNFADSDRDVDDGLGFGLGLGKAVAPDWNLELELRGHHLDADSGGSDLDLHDLSVNALYLFDRSLRISPFLVGGAGVLRADGDDDYGFTASAGAGLMFGLTDRLSLRTDARYRWDSVGSDYGDVLVGIGLSYAFGAAKPAPVAAEPEPQPVAPPPPPPLDSDGDGVPDSADRCPGTPAGAVVDSQGCELDSDGDGVVDRLDQCPDTARGTPVDRHGCPLPQVIELPDVNFGNDSAVLTPDSRRALDEAAEDLRTNPELKVEVAGHTDNRGAASYNQGLSERRAQSVRDYLVSQGVPAANLSVRGYGEDEPVADNDSPEGRLRNRRVELRVLD